MTPDRIYAIKGSTVSDQAEASSANPNAGNIQVRILIELQVISLILHEAFAVSEDLRQMRQDVADSIT